MKKTGLLLFILFLAAFVYIYIIEGNTEQLFFLFDGINLAVIAAASITNLKQRKHITLIGYCVFLAAPVELYEHISQNKIQYLLQYQVYLFNNNRLFPIAYTLFAANMVLFIYSALKRKNDNRKL